MNNFFGVNLFAQLRNRIKAVFGVFTASISVFACGAFMTFVLAPNQAILAYKVSQIPLMTAQSVEAIAPGGDVLITGIINGDAPTPHLPEFIAYTEERWDVTVSENENGNDNTPSGSWTRVQTVVPLLTLDMDGTSVSIQASNTATLNGALHEKLVDGTGSLQAVYEGQSLHDGAMRYKGLANGDLTTVFGKKASVGGVVPSQLFAGDRVAFEKYQRDLASSFLFMGITFMLCSPVVLVIGILGVLFGRKR
ncbi:MAG TPA: hypothetical protein PLD33_00100 [Anaerolineales bacterium]|nr:hypothetical protein [Anaerolineales bacterium]HNH77017.1 hypothetical protein [Anaerolineales bacterium]